MIFSGVIQESSGLPVGTGTLSLTGAGTYTGATTISAGTLMASNSSGSATGTQGESELAHWAVKGTVQGAVTIGSGALAQELFWLRGRFQSTRHPHAKEDDHKRSRQQLQRASRRMSHAPTRCWLRHTIESGAPVQLHCGGKKRFRYERYGFHLPLQHSANPISGTFANLADGSALRSRPQ